MKWLCTASLLLAPALAAAQTAPTTPDDAVQETVVVKALPPGPSDAPKKPSMQVRLDDYSLQSADFVFPSGLRVIMQEDHSEPLVGITMWVDRGSSSDPAGKEGIAHYIEHLWFKSVHGDLPQTWDLLDEMGCDLNASTDTDMTNFMTVCSKEFLPVMLELESARISETIKGVSEAQMLTEREVVRNELRMRMEVGGGDMFRYLMADIFPEGHPYHRETIGTHESLDAIRLSDIQAFVDANYHPENVTLVVVGDFDREAALSMLIDNFDLKNLDPRLTEDDVFRYPRPGVEHPDKANPDDWYYGVWDPDHRGEEMINIKATPPDRSHRAAEPPAPAQQENVHEAAISRAVAVASWSIPGSFQGDDVKWQLITSMLSQVVRGYFDEDTRIYSDPATKRKQVSCEYQLKPVNGMVMCYAQLASSKVDGIKVGWDIVDQVADVYSFDPTLLERDWSQGRMSFMRDILLDLDDVASLGGRQFQIAEWAHYTGSPTYHSDMIRSMTEGSVQEAQKAAYDYLKRNRAVISYMKPLPDDQVTLDSSEQAWHGAQREQDVMHPTAEDLSKVDTAYIESEAHIPDLTDLKETFLDNGMRVWVLPHGDAPLAEVRLIFGGGYSSDTDGHYTFARTFSDNDIGIGPEYDPLQFAGEYSTGSSDNYTNMSVLASSGNLDSSLWLLRSAVDTLEPDTAGKPQWVKRQKSRKIGEWLDKDDPFWAVDAITQQHWNPGHPITMDLMPDDYDRLGEFSTTDAKETLDRIYQPANATLLIVGHVDAEAATKLAEDYFGGWRARPGTAVGPYGVLPPPNPSATSRIVVFDNPGKTQTDATLTCAVGPVNDDNEMPLTLAGLILNQEAFQILRVQLGTTYGANAHFRSYEGGSGYVELNGQFQNSAAGTAVGVYLEMVKAMERGEVDPLQLKLQKLHRARLYGLGQQSNAQLTGRLTGAARHGIEWLESYPQRLAAVDPESVSKAMSGCSDRAIVTLVGPKEVITPLLDKEGITYEVFDWKAEGDRLVEQYDPKAWKKELKKRASEEDEAPQAAAAATSGGPASN